MTEFSLVTFNCHYGRRTPRDGCVPYDLADALDRLGDPDVLVVQEVWRPDGEPAVLDEWAAAKGYELHGVVFTRASVLGRWPQAHPVGEGTVGLAVLSRLPSRLVARLPAGAASLDHVPGRRVLHTEVVVGAATVHVVGVHLSSRLPFAPPIQLRTLAGHVRHLTGPAVVAGDCNFWGPPASHLLRGWRRPVRGRTWPAHRPHSQIDHVFLRGAIDVVEGRILAEVGSDHRPVAARLRVRPAPVHDPGMPPSTGNATRDRREVPDVLARPGWRPDPTTHDKEIR